MPTANGERRPAWRRWPVLAAVAMIAAAVVWFVPVLLYRHTGTDKAAKLKAVTDTRTALVAGFAGLVALISVSYTARTYRVTEQGHLTDRYTKAIDQLGSAKLDVRLGGIYALERIASDSERDHPTVVEVLSAYVREHTGLTRRHRQPSPAVVQSNAPRAMIRTCGWPSAG